LSVIKTYISYFLLIFIEKIMLHSLHIQNYRLFKDLKIEKLGQVNLIAGKNNAGKTALLEAIALSESDVNYCNNLLSSFVKLRGEFQLPYDDIVETFCDKSIEISKKGLKDYHFGEVNSIKVIVRIEELLITYNEQNYRYILCKKNLPDNKNQDIRFSPPDIDQIDRYFSEAKNKVVFLPFKTSFNISDLWENVDLTPRKKDVIKILQTIDPKIVDVGIDLRNRQPKVLLEGSIEPMPLDRFGDGVNRLFRIALCLVNAQNKTLLIDEFEAGLHYSVQEQLWEIIFKYAKKWNIQVFITTHSRDTISSFYYVANKNEYADMGNYLALAKEKDDIIVVDYDMEEISLALTSNIEIR
jgi:AAA15 family ATPase/GTPase